MIRRLQLYGFSGTLRLAINVFITKVFHRPARLIRSPFYIRGRNAVIWGKGFTTGVGVRIDALGDKPLQIIIGDGVQINDYVHIGAIDEIVIGDNVLIASKVFITDHNHGCYGGSETDSSPEQIPSQRYLDSAPVRIEKNVWVGESVSILPGVTIGQGAIVGAGAVVTRNVEANTIVAGIPAKIVKTYSETLKTWKNTEKSD